MVFVPRVILRVGMASFSTSSHVNSLVRVTPAAGRFRFAIPIYQHVRLMDTMAPALDTIRTAQASLNHHLTISRISTAGHVATPFQCQRLRHEDVGRLPPTQSDAYCTWPYCTVGQHGLPEQCVLFRLHSCAED